MNFEELSKEWLNENHKANIKERTYLRYECLLRCDINDVMGEEKIENFTPRLLQHYLNIIREKKSERTKRTISASTFNSIITIINMIFEYAVNFELLNQNPACKLKRARIDKSKSTSFTRQEQIKIENYIDSLNDDEYFPIILCFYTGLRIGELLALTFNDIDLRAGVMKINKTKYRTKINGIWVDRIASPKTKTSNREIPLPYFLVEKLRELKKKKMSKYICVKNDGTPMDDKFLRNRFTSLLKKTHVKRLNFHSIRHTFATRALENRMDIKTLSEVLGHSNASTTLNIYAHALIEHKKSAMRKIKRINS